jgi:hypothetical protein
MIVKNTFTHTFGNGLTVTVPAGARTQRIVGETEHRWVDPSIFPRNSIERWDADHYGIRVPLSNIEEA